MRTSKLLMRLGVIVILVFGVLSLTAKADDALRDFKGNITTLEAQQEPDKWTVVMIWASDCHVCNQEANSYSSFHTAHADKDAKIIGISIDGQQGQDDAEAFISRNEVIFPNLIGDVGAVADWYQSITGEPFRATPTFVVLDSDGNIKAAQPGAVPPELIEKFIAAN